MESFAVEGSKLARPEMEVAVTLQTAVLHLLATLRQSLGMGFAVLTDTVNASATQAEIMDLQAQAAAASELGCLHLGKPWPLLSLLHLAAGAVASGRPADCSCLMVLDLAESQGSAR